MFWNSASGNSPVTRKVLKNRAALRQHATWHPVESLETRRMLTGTWSSFTNSVPSSDGAANAMLLTNGTIMVHGGSGGASAAWYKLTPNNGSYNTGTWSTLASMSTGRLFFASEVLPSGKVWVQGGEYSSTVGFVNTGEMYDPVANTWSYITTFPQSSYGDDPTELLPNGNILSGYISSAATYIYNVSGNTWATTGTKLNGDRSDEESWVTLPDGTILSYDVFSSISSGTPHAQRYYPSTGTWVDAGTPPAQLSAASVGYEMGPGILLPDKRVLYTGGTNATAYYNYSNNSWTAGPNMPNGYVMADAPGALLPNGDVLLAMSPKGGLSGSAYNFPSPTYVYELNPTTNVYTLVTPSLSGFSMTQPSYKYTFLVLPTGQVMMTNDSGKIAMYTPDGSPNSSWAPSISNITNDQGTNTFTVSGYQLNGISEGAAYGDDDEMSSNYPIVKLTDQSGNITFARTFNWSTGVGSVSSSFNFTDPGGTGAYLVNVIANGIASPTVLELQCSSSTGENWIAQQNANTNYLDFNLINSGVVATFYIGSFNELIMTGDAASNTLVANCNLYGRATLLDGGDGMDYLRVENNGTGYVASYGGNGDDYFDSGFYNQNLSNQTGFVYEYGGAGTNSAFMYDRNYSTVTTYTLNSAEVNRAGFGGMYYDAAIDYLTVNTGYGAGNTFNISSTYYNTPVFINCNSSTYVNIGSNGSVQGVAAAITLTDTPNYMTINVDDSQDSGSPNATIGTYTPTGDTAYGSIAGLAPGQINYRLNDTSSITVLSGTGSSNIINVQASARYLTLNESGGTCTVNFGNSTQGVQAITSTVILNDAGGHDYVNVDNSTDSAAAHTTYLYFATINSYNSQLITGLAPGNIYAYLGGLAALNVSTGTVGGNVTNIQQMSVPFALIGHCPFSGVHDTVNVGNNGVLSDISGSLTITNPPGYTDINFNDSNDAYAGTWTLSSYLNASSLEYGSLQFPYTTLFGSLTLYNTLNFRSTDITSLTLNVDKSVTANIYDTATSTVINEPSGGASPTGATLTANITGTSSPFTLNTTNDLWTVNATNAGTAQGLNGAIAVTSSGFGSEGALNVDDSADATARIVTISDSQITGIAPATISYPNYRTQFNVSGGYGGNTFTVTTTPVGGLYPTNILNDGSRSDTVVVNGTQASFSSGALIVNTQAGSDQVTLGTGTLSNFASPVTVNGGTGADSVLLADQTNTGSDTYNISSTTVTRPSFGGLTYTALHSLQLEAETGNNIINVNSTAYLTPVSVGANAGTDTINVNQTDTTAPVTIEPSTGNDAVNVDTTGSPGATALFAANQSIGLLTIGNNGIALEAYTYSGTRLLLQTNGVVTSGSGVLNQVNNDTIDHATSLAAIGTLVKAGFNAGGVTWAGPGITSSSAAGDLNHLTAIGAILNTYDGGTNTIFNSSHLFDGVAPSVTDVLTKFTYFGDANLDGKVDGSDYSRIDSGYVAHVGGWYNGDFNYDGVVNGSDYALIDNAFNSQGSSLAAEVATPATQVSTPFASQPIAVKAKTSTAAFEMSQFSKPVAISQLNVSSSGIYEGLKSQLNNLAGRGEIQTAAPGGIATQVTPQKRRFVKPADPASIDGGMQITFLA